MSKNKKKKQKAKDMSRSAFAQEVLSVFRKYPMRSFNYKQIAKRIGVKDVYTKELIAKTLEYLAENEKIGEMNRGKYKLSEGLDCITGIVEMNAKGAAYIVSQPGEWLENDVYVPQKLTNQALHGDEVRVELRRRRKNGMYEGEIIEIIKRAKTTFAGTVEVTSKAAFFVPMSRHVPFDIFIPFKKLNKAQNGQRALAEITKWDKNDKNPTGEIVEVLGDTGENEVEIHAILAEFDLPYQFPNHLKALAEKIPEKIEKDEIARRRDFRHITTFTIDPHDAKDFDDALSISRLENGNFEIGVHIADVTHYVKPDSALDNEAYERGTSVYLVDRVVPMLPERLSNFICSLRPNEEKLTFSTVFEMDKKGHIINTWYGRTVIRSDRRFTYDEVQDVIVTKKGDYAKEILELDRLAKQLRERRFQNGSINFNKVEMQFQLDENAHPQAVHFKKSSDANHLIEEFMLAANQSVAKFVAKKSSKTFVYRVHDEPDADKLETFNKFVKRFGYKIRTASSGQISESMNQMLKKIQGHSEQNIIEQLAIRSMAKAEYSTENIGHYGLAFEHYTHFTSPIRRYPDMMVHRLLARYLDEGRSVTQKKYEKMCKHASEMERRAVMAERASIKFKQVEFMQSKLGEVFDAVISGVTEWGLFAEIAENKIEGLIPVRDLDDDYYTYDRDNFCLTGEHTKKRYYLGDNIRVRLVRTDINKKQIDLMIEEE